MKTPIELHLILTFLIIAGTFGWPVTKYDENGRRIDPILKALALILIGSILFILNWLWFIMQ